MNAKGGCQEYYDVKTRIKQRCPVRAFCDA